ncbi:MAG TPA: carboxypeptidase-like regulatory domain-containing protein [bacterium]|nr:carboxypeptidase-like regulatory domain-containing protein [bacterium]
MKKVSLLIICSVLLCFSCEENKKLPLNDDIAVDDGDTIVYDNDQKESELPDVTDNAPVDDAVSPTDEDGLLSDEDLITKTTCLETGEGCAGNEICLYDWQLAGYYCEDACDPLVTDDCPEGLWCEPVAGDTKSGCFLPVIIAGRVFDLDEIGYPAIEGARVSAMDQKDGSATDVSVTDSTGHYAIPLSLIRQRNGMPLADEVYIMRAAAKDHAPYPGPGQVALPILMENCTLMGDGYYVSSGFLDIGLAALAEEAQGGFIVSGSLSETTSGVLVIARCATAPCPYTYTGAEGDFTIYNVLPGDYEIVKSPSAPV